MWFVAARNLVPECPRVLSCVSAMPLASVGVGAGAGVGLVGWIVSAVWPASLGANASMMFSPPVPPPVSPDSAGLSELLGEEDVARRLGATGLIDEAMLIADGARRASQAVVSAVVGDYSFHDIFDSDVTDHDEDVRRAAEEEEVDRREGCVWWHHGMEPRSDLSCTTNGIIRASTAVLAAGLQRAKRCSSVRGDLTECVLTHEVGLGVPGFYIHDDDCDAGTMRAVLAPTRVPLVPHVHEDEASALSMRRIRVQSPAEHGPHSRTVHTYNNTIRLQYIGGSEGGMHLETRTMTGPAAYCFQLLLESVSPACAERILL